MKTYVNHQPAGLWRPHFYLKSSFRKDEVGHQIFQFLFLLVVSVEKPLFILKMSPNSWTLLFVVPSQAFHFAPSPAMWYLLYTFTGLCMCVCVCTDGRASLCVTVGWVGGVLQPVQLVPPHPSFIPLKYTHTSLLSSSNLSSLRRSSCSSSHPHRNIRGSLLD